MKRVQGWAIIHDNKVDVVITNAESAKFWATQAKVVPVWISSRPTKKAKKK